MYGISYEEIVKKIKEEKGISEQEIGVYVNKKLEQYGDLISREGAIHIVANELKVKVFDDSLSNRKFKVSNVLPGMNFVNIVVGDETGIVRLVLWDEKYIALVEKGEIKSGEILRVKNAYSRGTDVFPELHIGGRGVISLNPEGVEVGEPVMMKKSFLKKKIADLKDNDAVEIAGTLVQVFEPRFYNSCSSCGKKVEVDGTFFKCSLHGQVTPVDVPIINIFLDDGSDNVRVVLFRDLVTKLIGENPIKYKDNPAEFEGIRNDMLGKQYRINGRVNRNAMFDRVEFMAQEISELNAQDLADDILKEIDSKF